MFSPKQYLNVELFDSDMVKLGRGDDTLGEMWLKEEGRKANLCDVLKAPDKWWKVYEKRGTQYEECGQIRICVEAYNLRADAKLFDNSQGQKPTKHGKACADGLLSVQLRGLRGLPKKFAQNATLTITCKSKGREDTKIESVKSKLMELDLDLSMVEVDPSVQRMVEFLALDGKPIETITEVSGLTDKQVSMILDQRPSFHTRWNQSLHIPIVNPEEAEFQLRLNIQGESESAAPIELVAKSEGQVPALKPFKIKDLLQRKHCHFEELVKMDRVVGPQGKVKGPFELDLAVQLFGLLPTDLRQLES
jgi:hypothetical protein